MKVTIAVICITLAAAVVLAASQREHATRSKDASAETYEQLATAIIAIRKTEDGLVKGIIMNAHASADRALAQAASAMGDAKKQALEMAAAEITNAANEGDKPVLAIRQRLSKAGHTHNTDSDTKEDYLWVNSKEKKQLLDLARRVSQMGADASAEQIRQASQELGGIMDKSLQPE